MTTVCLLTCTYTARLIGLAAEAKNEPNLRVATRDRETNAWKERVTTLRFVRRGQRVGECASPRFGRGKEGEFLNRRTNHNGFNRVRIIYDFNFPVVRRVHTTTYLVGRKET